MPEAKPTPRKPDREKDKNNQEIRRKARFSIGSSIQERQPLHSRWPPWQPKQSPTLSTSKAATCARGLWSGRS